jgi:hypothetical protein
MEIAAVEAALLSASGFYLFEDGISLESKSS